MAKHRYRSSYWEFRSYQAQFRPSLTLSGQSQTMSSDSQITGLKYKSICLRCDNNVTSSGTLSLSQAIGLTSTTFSLQSSLIHLFDFTPNAIVPRQYSIAPVSINITQPIRQYNTLKWQRKIEPVKYDAAKNISCKY